MGAPTGTTVTPLVKPWRGYPSANVVHGVRVHVNQDPAKYVSTGFAPGAAQGVGHVALTPGGAAVHVGTIPLGAIILPIAHHLLVAFAPAGTLSLGTLATPGGLLNALALTTPAFTGGVSTGALMGYQAETIQLYVKITGSGAATAGEIDIVVPFYIHKD